VSSEHVIDVASNPSRRHPRSRAVVQDARPMQHLSKLFAVLALGVAGCATEAAETTATLESAVTTHDVDVAPECEGIIGYVNWAPLQELDAYLPYTVANAITQRRATQPFVDLADVSSISGIAQARLEQITNRAYNLDFIDAECAGVYEELAVSHDDRIAILAYVNTAPEAELAEVARSQNAATAAALVAGRPYTTLQAVVDRFGVGPSTFRSIRNAAIADPFDDLVARVNGVERDVAIRLNFDWFALMYEQPGQQGSMVCFGVPADVVADFGGVMRPNLADGAEVLAEVTSSVDFADRYNEVGDATAGLAHLAAQVAGHEFLGCYISYHPDPWSGVNRAFFVDKVTGYRVFTETRWSE
jgi:DNA uptake protein ComE-like DNA-binding protein